MQKQTDDDKITRLAEAGWSVRVLSTYTRDGEIILEQSEFVDANVTIDELIRLAKRFESVGAELFEMRIELIDSGR